MREEDSKGIGIKLSRQPYRENDVPSSYIIILFRAGTVFSFSMSNLNTPNLKCS